MILKSISHFKEYNYSNDLKLYMMNLERLDFHQECMFPYNILILIKSDSDKDDSYIYCRQTDTKLILKQGNYYFIPTNVSVEYKLAVNILFYTFHVGFEVCPGMDLFASYPRILSGKARNFLMKIEKIYQENDEFLGLCLLRKFMLDFFIEHWPDKYYKAEKIPIKFLELMHYAKVHVDAEMTVQSLANKINMTPEAFSRKFHRLVQMPPKEFIAKCLVDKIASFLCDSDKTIKEISKELNFSSEFYLSRFFKKYMKMPPTAYKNMVHGKIS